MASTPRPSLALAVVPRFAQVASETDPDINRIRITARDVSTNAVVGSVVTAVNPADAEWQISLEVELPASGALDVQLTIELLHADGATESVEWSGTTTVSVSAAQRSPVAVVEVYRGPPANLTVTSVQISGAPSALIEGASAALVATASNATGTARIFWNALDASIATVDDSGNVHGVRPGAARVVASAGPHADTVTLNVVQRAAAVQISPPSATVPSLGSIASFQASVLDPRGAPIAGAAVTWTVADSTVAENLNDGRFRARANGATTVTASAVSDPSVHASAQLVVGQRIVAIDLNPRDRTLTQTGAQQQFTAVARDGLGNPGATSFHWSSSNEAVATIDGNGLATARGNGSTTIRVAAASVDGIAGDSIIATTTLTVSQDVALVQVLPAHDTLYAIGDTVHLVAHAFDSHAVEASGRTFTWTSSDPAVASVTADGTVKAISAGEASVRAETGGVGANAVVVVAPNPTQVVITPAYTTAVLQQHVQFNATVRDRNGNVLVTGAPVWQSSDTTVAIITASGLAYSVGHGTTTISATFDSVTGHATLSVAQALRTVTITPADATLDSPGDTITLAAIVKDSLGALVADAPITWTTHDGSIATVDANGLVTAQAAGSATITATSGDASGDANVTVLSHAPVAIVEVQPDHALLPIGATLALAATAYDVDEALIADATFTWTSSKPALAVVSSTGLVNALRAGDVVITATSGASSATSQITIYTPIASLLETVSGNEQDATVNTAEPDPVVVRLLDQYDNPLPGRRIKWQVASGGGSVTSDTSTTDAAGMAQMQWTLGPVAGAQTLRASFGTISGSPLTFTAHAEASELASVQVTPDTKTLTAGATFSFTASARDASNNVLPDVVFSWSSSDTTVASVNDAGQVNAARVGTAMISATANGISDSAQVTVTAGAAAALLHWSGSGQAGHASQPLDDSLVVQVTDVAGNPVSGRTVNWVVTAGGGTASPISSVSDADGLARTSWTLGSVAGTQTLEARAGRLAGSPVVFVASASGPAGIRRTWIGGDAAAPTNWATVGNWQPAGIPSDVDTAYIPFSAANQPTISGYQTVGGLIVETDAFVDLSGYGITVHHDVDVAGTIINVGEVLMDGIGAHARGIISGLHITGTVSASGPLTVDRLIIDCANDGVNCTSVGDLALNGNTVTVRTDFDASSGTLTMTNTSDQLLVSGHATFTNIDETGRLTAGVIEVGGDLSNGCYNDTELVPTGTRIIMNGTAPQHITLCSSSTGNQLYDLTIASGAQVSTDDNPLFIANTLTVDGTFDVGTSAVVDVAGPAGSLVVSTSGVANNHGVMKANLPISGTVNFNPVIQR